MSCTPGAGPAQIGTAYSSACTASGGTPPYSWSVTSGGLPSGLTLTPNAADSHLATLAGTPTAIGSYSFSVTVTDSAGPAAQASQPFSGTVSGAPIPAPAAHWTFDTTDISGNQVTDSSDNGLTGTLVNAASVPGRVNQALGFSGGGSYVMVPGSAALDLLHDLTLAAWVQTTNSAQTQVFYQQV